MQCRCRFHKSRRKSRQKWEQKRLEHVAADDPEAYQNWVHSVEKQRIQVCCMPSTQLSFHFILLLLGCSTLDLRASLPPPLYFFLQCFYIVEESINDSVSVDLGICNTGAIVFSYCTILVICKYI